VKALKKVVGLCLLLLLPLPAMGESVAWESGAFWQGAAGGLLLHELGHVITGVSYGEKPQLNRGSIVYPRNHFTRRSLLHVASSGFQAQWLFSEVALDALSKPADAGVLERQHYVGMVSMHLAISAAYLVALKDMPTSDLYAVSASTGVSREQLAWMVMLPAALDGYRLLGEDVPEWVGHLSMGFKGAAMMYVWTF